MTAPKLSILIASITKRADMFDRLVVSLQSQVSVLDDPDEVEILALVDNRELSIGAKRNKLLQMAKGDYTVFIDDDDRVWADYVCSILDAMAGSAPDWISITMLVTFDNAKPQIARYKLNEPANKTVGGFGCIHVCPIRRSIAVSVPFIDAGHGEDIQWTKRVAPLLKTVAVVPQPVYHYNFQNQVSETKTSRHNAAFPDDVLVDLQGLPDWAFFDLVRNEGGVTLARRKKFAEYLVNIGSPYAKNQVVVDLLADNPSEAPIM